MVYLLLPLLGFLWVLVAVVTTDARQKKVPVFYFFMIGAFFASLMFLGINLLTGMENFFSAEHWKATLSLALAAIFNGLGQALVMYNLKKGGRALAFAIPQLAFVMPYTWSIIFMGEKFSLSGVTGLLMIAVAMCYLSMKKTSASSADVGSSTLEFKRILLALVAMVLIGSSHIGMSFQTQFPPEQRLKVFSGSMVMQITAMFLFLVFICCSSKGNFFAAVKKSWKHSMMWAVLAVLSYIVMFTALEKLGSIKQAGIVFPIGCCLLIVLFALYTAIRYREKLSWGQIVAFSTVVAGILLVKM